MTCDCGVRVQRLADGRIVLDIAEGAPRPPLPDLPDAARNAEPATSVAPTAPALAPPAPAAGTASPALARAPRPVARPASITAAAARSVAAEPAVPAPAQTPARPATAPAAEPARDTVAAEAPPLSDPREDAAATATSPLLGPSPAAIGQTETTDPTETRATEPSPGTSPDTVAQDESATPTDPVDETAATVAAARQQLLRQLTRAAEEGLLTLADPSAKAEIAAEAESGTAQGAARDEADLPLRARTGTEIAAEAERARTVATPRADAPPAHCLDAAQFDIAAWSGDAPIGLQMGVHRRAMVGEFDRANTAAVLAYVRLLIAKGFGLEAESALRAFVADLPATPVLWDLARIVDREAPKVEGIVAAGLDCPGPHALWATAARALAGTLDPEAIDADRLRGPLGTLPPAIRTRIAVPIATVALEAGRINTAEAVVAIAARADPPGPDGDGMLKVLLARIDAARGDWGRAEAALRPLIWQTSTAGIEAAIRMVEFRLARGSAPPQGLADNMEALAFTLGQTALARQLIKAAAAARASGEGLGLALTALRALAERGGDPSAARLAARDILIDYAPDEAEGAAYAEAVLAHEGLLGTDPDSDRARFAIARHFAALGLGNLAEHILAPPLSRDVPGARLIAAEAAIAAGDPQSALGLLGGTSGSEAARLRATALAALGRYDAAVEALAEVDDPQTAARYAWLAGQWQAAAGAGSTDHRILAAWMAGEAEMPEDLRAAAEVDPALAERLRAFSRDTAGAGTSVLEDALDALEAARRHRALMGELLGDG